MVLLAKTHGNSSILFFEYTRLLVVVNRHELFQNIITLITTGKPFIMTDKDDDTLEMMVIDGTYKISINGTSTLFNNEQLTKLVCTL